MLIPTPKINLEKFLEGKAILIVEPSINYRTSIKQFLSNLRVKNIKFANSIADAKREMLTAQVGLFIVEWKQKDRNGIQFCKEIRKKKGYKNTPFLLISTENLKQDVILASEMNVSAYLLKPFSYEDFCRQIELMIRNHSAPSELNNLLEAGDQALEAGELEKADRSFTEAMNQKPSARAFLGLSKIEKAKKNYNGAFHLVKQAIQMNPQFIEAYKEFLEVATLRKDDAHIFWAATELHKLSPDNPSYPLVLAQCHLDKGELDASKKFFRQVVILSPTLAAAYKGLGNIAFAEEDFGKAEKYFDKALDLDDRDVSILNSLGMTLVRMGRFEEGISKYIGALRYSPKDARVLFNLGHAYERQGKIPSAIEYYQKALRQERGYTKAKEALERLGAALPTEQAG